LRPWAGAESEDAATAREGRDCLVGGHAKAATAKGRAEVAPGLEAMEDITPLGAHAEEHGDRLGGRKIRQPGVVETPRCQGGHGKGHEGGESTAEFRQEVAEKGAFGSPRLEINLQGVYPGKRRHWDNSGYSSLQLVQGEIGGSGAVGFDTHDGGEKGSRGDA
jgi:hypothetical protein